MSKYKRFWVYDKGGDRDGPYNYKAQPVETKNYYNNNPVYEVIERAALDEAKDYIERLIYSYYNPNEMDFDAVVLNAEKFLKGFGEG